MGEEEKDNLKELCVIYGQYIHSCDVALKRSKVLVPLTMKLSDVSTLQ